MVTQGHVRGVPYHRFGTGSQPLVILPGVMDSLGWNTPRRVTTELLSRYYFRGFSEYDVWVVSRPPGLPSEVTLGWMAEQYAQFIESLDSAHVLGLSLGGAVAAYLARHYPTLVDRLVLVACGTALGTRGRHIVRRWRAFARTEQWRSLHIDYARQMYTGAYRRIIPILYQFCGPLLPRPVVGTDVVQSCDCLLDYDGRAVASDIEAPTLVVADTDGPLFPVTTQQELARCLETGYVATVPGSHAVYEQSRETFSDVIRRFLAGQHTD